MKISVRLPLTITALIVLPIVVAFYLGYGYIHEELHVSNENKLVAIAKIRTQQVKEYLDSHEERLQAISEDDGLKEALLSRKESLEHGRMRSHLSAILAATNANRVVCFDANGNYIDSTDGAADQANVLAYKNVQKENQKHVYTYLFKDKQPRIGMIKGVYRDGALIGFIAYSFGHEWLDAINSDYVGLGRTGEVTMAGWSVDKVPYRFTRLRFAEYSSTPGVVNIKQPKLAMTAALKGIEGFSHDYLDYRGVSVIAATGYLKKYGIAIVAKVDTDEAHESIRRIMTLSAAALFISLAVLMILVWFALRKLGRRIELHAKTAQKISDGDLDARLYDIEKDELGQLCTVLNDMTKKLVGMNNELERRVAAAVKDIQEAHDKFRYIFEYSPVGKSITSPSGDIQVNHSFCKILGYSEEELKDGRWQDITHPDDIELTNRFLAPLLAGEQESTRFTKRYFHKNGSVVWADVSTALRRDSLGSPVYFISSVMDITERKLVEEELHKTHENLEKVVLERTAKLQEANKELESFAYSVSHDLRTPLRAIDGFSHQLLKRYTDKLDDEGKRYLNIVRDNAKKMAQLIDDILAFSRMGRLDISLSQVDMRAVATEVYEELRTSATGREIAMRFASALPLSRGDYAMIRQVWVNLINNAIKFTRPKELAQIEVGGYGEGGENIYYIKDNGVGFDMQYADKLFGVFQRLHSVEEFEGTGIGLAIVNRIVTRHGGRTWAIGKVGEGATIYFTLPILGEKNDNSK
jgi:PAS domain S-box-containing protein